MIVDQFLDQSFVEWPCWLRPLADMKHIFELTQYPSFLIVDGNVTVSNEVHPLNASLPKEQGIVPGITAVTREIEQQSQ